MKTECRGFFSYEVLKNPLRIGFSPRKPVFESNVVVGICSIYYILCKLPRWNQRNRHIFKENSLGRRKSSSNIQSFVSFFSSKNCPRNVRQPTRCRAGEFFRAEKKLGQNLNDARNSILPRNEYYTSGIGMKWKSHKLRSVAQQFTFVQPKVFEPYFFHKKSLFNLQRLSEGSKKRKGFDTRIRRALDETFSAQDF